MSQLPRWDEFMKPILQVQGDGEVRNRRQIFQVVADHVALSDDDRRVTLLSGQPAYENRIGWALSFLVYVGALDRPQRGQYRITQAGQELVARFPGVMSEKDVKELCEDPSSGLHPYVASTTRQSRRPIGEGTQSVEMTPLEQIQDGIGRIHDEVAADLLKRLQAQEPAFFEQAVVDLLVAMGYGGVGGRGTVTQLTNDGGIDGVVDQDVLGLRRVYIQAKRFAEGNSVGRPDIQRFVGALTGKADSGVFLTTSVFSDHAIEWARNLPVRVILVDGRRLADLMIKYSVGVQVSKTFEAVEVDEDFFS